MTLQKFTNLLIAANANESLSETRDGTICHMYGEPVEWACAPSDNPQAAAYESDPTLHPDYALTKHWSDKMPFLFSTEQNLFVSNGNKIVKCDIDGFFVTSKLAFNGHELASDEIREFIA